jgi:SAM-dependent methyltransferase
MPSVRSRPARVILASVACGAAAMNIVFTDNAIEFLRKHKGDDYSIYRQVIRSQRQLLTVKHLLDQYKPKSMLDIGCGLGVSSTMIAKYSNVNYLALLDGDGSGELFSDFREDAPAWNDVRIAGDLARANLCIADTCKVETFFPDRELTIPVDLIVSFKSWGTHYPVNTYLPLAARSLKPGGLVVLDLRPDDEFFRIEQRAAVERAGFELVERAGDRRHVFVRVRDAMAA